MGDPFSGLGSRCFVFGNGEDDEEYLRSCGKTPADIGDAEFVLARGLFEILAGDGKKQYTREAEAQVLTAALSRMDGGLPLLVANPDELRPDGKDSPMPGQLARRYKEMGGKDIRLVGKPHPLIYEACRRRLESAGVGMEARVLGVGDSLPHDVLGAACAGIDSLFVCSGVHYKQLGVPQASDQPPHPHKLSVLIDEFENEHGCRPTHAVAAFRLGLGGS